MSGGRAFLDYRIEEPIGQGGMGVVYLADDTRLRRKVALKLIAPELALDERFRERFVRESELAMSLEHPNVVPIHDAGEADGRLYLAMRCVDGSDLRALLRKEGTLEPVRALAIVRQIGQALDAAHARGLVHRDVKPSNVLVDESEHVYLADFGLTRRQAEDGTQPGDARSLGTPAYLAPEQIEGGPIDGRADVYSLGCLLYECLTGEPPFPASSRLEVAWAHLEGEPPRAAERNPALPAAVDDVIRKAMAKHPDDRHSTCGELVAAAEGALGVRQPARSKRRRWLLLLAATLAACVAVLAVALIRRDDAAVAESLAVRANTLVRIDPAKNEIAAVVGTGRNPTATAAAGDSVWVYDSGDHTVSEIDAHTNEREHTSKVSTSPTSVALERGPFLAADADGAWVIGYDVQRGTWLLTRVLSDGRGTLEQSFGMALEAVAVADRTVWLLARRDDDDLVVLRIDPRKGRVQARTPLRLAGPSGAPLARTQVGEGQGLAVGGGYVWVTDAGSGTLHRLDPRTGETRRVDFGIFVTRPAFGFGRVWLCVWDSEDGSMLRVDPRTLANELARDALKAEEGHFAIGYGSLWRLDNPTGTLMRFRPRSGDPAGLVPVRSRAAPGSPFLVFTSLSTGADAVWLSVAKG